MLKVVVFGAGRVGKLMIRNLEQVWGESVNILAVVDNFTDASEFHIGNHKYPIIKQEEIKNTEFDYIFICVSKGYEKIKEELLDAQVEEEKIISYGLDLYKDNLGNVYEMMRKMSERESIYLDVNKMYFSVPFMVVITGSACTLKCRDCANFSPYAPAETRSYDYKLILKNISEILQAADEIETLQIQGGEPFIYKELGTILDYLIQETKIKRVQIATNGCATITDHIMQRLKNPKFHVRISNYGEVNCGHASNMAKLLKDNGVDMRVYSFAAGNDMWYHLGGVIRLARWMTKWSETDFRLAAS